MGCNSWPKCHHKDIRPGASRNAASNVHRLLDRREVIVSVVDFIEAWWLSVRALVESTGVIGRFERSATNRPNPSCALNLRRNALETDLLVWESGEAELAVVELDGSVTQQHFEDIRKQPDLGMVLSRLVAMASDTQRLT